MSYQSALLALVSADSRYVVMTAENHASLRTVIPHLGDRFIDTGIAEQALIGAAAGLALRGRIPVVHALSAFLTMRAYEFIRTDIGIAHLPVKLCGGVPGFLSEANGPTHQAVEDIALMRTIPNMQIFCPADEEDLLIGLTEMLSSPSPCYIRLNHQPAAFHHERHFLPGSAEVVSRGIDVTILVYGTLLTKALRAAELLRTVDISVSLINVRTLNPFDYGVLIKAAEETPLLVTIEDHYVVGGLFSLVSETLVQRGIACKVMPMALNRKWFRPAPLRQVLAHEGFTAHKIAETIMKAYKGAAHYA